MKSRILIFILRHIKQYGNFTKNNTVSEVFIVLKFRLILAAFILAIVLSSLYFISQSKARALVIITGCDTVSLTPSDNDVQSFTALNKDYSSGYENDLCYNITPDYIKDNTDYEIFKYSQSSASLLLYENHVYQLGGYFGGTGITNTALADINRDGQYELYFTFSWGSGLHRSQVGYFDPALEEVVIFDYVKFDIDLMFTEQNNNLVINKAKFSDRPSFVEFSVTAKEEYGIIEYRNGFIQLIPATT